MMEERRHNDYVTLKELMETKLRAFECSREMAHKSIDKRLQQLEDDSRELRDSKAKLEGKADQSSVVIANIIAVLALIIGIIKFFIK